MEIISKFKLKVKIQLSLIAVCFITLKVHAENHIITHEISVNEEVIKVSPVLKFDTSQAIKEAIDNGVRISLIAKSQLYVPKNWWFDNLIEKQHIEIEVYYFKLGRLYVAKNQNTNEQISVNEYEEIWQKFEQIINIEFKNPQYENLWVQSRVMLDTSALPTTMQLPVLFNNEWDINTQWYLQPINQETSASE